MGAWRKVMTVYCPFYRFGHVRGEHDAPESAPEPYANIEYGTLST